MIINFPNSSPPEPRRRATRNESDATPRSSPLREHPKRMEFVFRLGQRILSRYPDLRPVFLELLDEIDTTI